LGHLGAVHGGGHAQSVPMNIGRLLEPVREADLENVPYPRFERGTGDLPVVSPGAHGRAGGEGPVDFAGFEIDRDDVPAGVWLRRFVGLAIGHPRIRRRLMSDAAVMVVVRCVIVMGRHFGSLGSSLWAVGTAAVAVKTPMGCAGSAAQRELTAQRLVRAMQPDPGVVSR